METIRLPNGKINMTTTMLNTPFTSLHNHDSFELCYIKMGEVMHSSCEQKEKLKPGDAMLISPEIAHKFDTVTTIAYEQRDILIRQGLLEMAADFIDPAFYDDIINRKIIRFTLSDEDMGFLERKLVLFLSDKYSDSQRKHYENIIVAWLLGFIYMESQNNMKGGLDFKNRCLLSINSHLVDPDIMRFLDAELGYNRVYLAKKFHQQFGTTISKYILSLRLNHAEFLLLTTACSIEQCCYSIGLESVTYFIKTFKHKFGMTPAKYRKQHSVNKLLRGDESNN